MLGSQLSEDLQNQVRPNFGGRPHRLQVLRDARARDVVVHPVPPRARPRLGGRVREPLRQRIRATRHPGNAKGKHAHQRQKRRQFFLHVSKYSISLLGWVGCSVAVSGGLHKAAPHRPVLNAKEPDNRLSPLFRNFGGGQRIRTPERKSALKHPNDTVSHSQRTEQRIFSPARPLILLGFSIFSLPKASIISDFNALQPLWMRTVQRTQAHSA